MDEGDDGRIRTGTLWSTIAHAITATIGSGVLALPWSVAQLGWIVGPFTLIFFPFISYFTASLLCDCYRYPGPTVGRRNYTYIGAVKAFLGAKEVRLCAIVQYSILWGAMVGYTVTTATSMATVKRAHCVHNKGHDAKCSASGTFFLILYGVIEIILSQFPNLEKVTLLSILAAITSFAYSFIASYLSIAKFVSHPKARGSLVNLDKSITESAKVFHSFQALGNIAFAYTYCMLLLEIQDTIKSPPAETKTMKKTTAISITVTTIFYSTLGGMGYLAFGNDAPGNVLTGFIDPFWLVDTANISVIIHLVAAYQVFAQPLYAIHEEWLASRWPTVGFFNTVYTLGLPGKKGQGFEFTLAKLFLRPAFVAFTTFVAIMFPFFNAILGLLGAVAFWPLTVFFPLSMYMVQAKIKKGSSKWILLQCLSFLCLVVSILSGIGSVADIVDRLKHATLFKIEL